MCIKFAQAACRQANGHGAITTPGINGEGDFVSYCIPRFADRKSTVENSAHHAQPRLSPAEKARRVAELRAVLHAPAFRARIDAGERRDLP